MGKVIEIIVQMANNYSQFSLEQKKKLEGK